MHKIKLDGSVEIYFSFPREVNLKPSLFDSKSFFYRNIKGSRLYSLQNIELPLVQSKFISELDSDLDGYRVNLNVFVYNCMQAVAKQAKSVRQKHENIDEFIDFVGILTNLMNRFRNSKPEADKFKLYFEQADNYLSWHIEQKMLSAIGIIYKKISVGERRHILDFCQKENSYRLEMQYNSKNIVADPSKMSSKMMLLKKVIEQGVVFKEKTKELGGLAKKITTGFVASLIMLVVYLFLMQANEVLDGLTVMLVFTIALTYGLREIFKEDMREIIMRFLRKGKPILLRHLIDSTSNNIVAVQNVWIDLVEHKNLPCEINDIFSMIYRRYKKSSYYLYYKSDIDLFFNNFCDGYDGISEEIYFDLSYFLKSLPFGKKSFFYEDSGKILKSPIENQYEVNILILINNEKTDNESVLYKGILDSSGFISIDVI